MVGARRDDNTVSRRPGVSRRTCTCSSSTGARADPATLARVTDVQADLTIDGGDLGCARLLVLLRDRVATLPAGAVVHLITADPVAPIDLPVWCHMTGHGYLGTVDGRDRPTYAVQVASRPAPTDARNPWHPAAPRA